jgi:hypothetical protein
MMVHGCGGFLGGGHWCSSGRLSLSGEEKREGRGNEQRGREGAMCGVFVRASSLRHGRVEATRRRDSEDGPPRPSSSF